MIKENPSYETQGWNVSSGADSIQGGMWRSKKPQFSKRAWYFTAEIRILLNKILYLRHLTGVAL